jgi:putative restriction endonuclease
MQLELKAYAKAFTKLKRGSTPFGLAPHKPIFLLSIIDLIDQGEIMENKIYINTQLVASFLNNWEALVKNPLQPDFKQPFYYLQNDKLNGSSFWFVKPLQGCQFNAHIKSFNKLITVVDYGYFSQDLYFLLREKNSREVFKQILLETYFQNYQNSSLNNDYLNDLVSNILNEPIPAYNRLINENEEVVFVRNGLFKKLVPFAYNQTCAFTGWKVQTSSGLSLVDACHIKPFSICKEDFIKNGISLSPNIHRAFDRGMLGVDDEYRILVSKQIIENNEGSNSLKKLEGQMIILPEKELHYPGQEYLLWHRKNCFKN